jgi:hypothetical protein
MDLSTLVFAGLCFNLAVLMPIGGVIGHLARNRAGDGAALGFLLGPVGWMLIFALADCRRRCDHCRSVVDASAAVCPRCKRPLSPWKKPKPSLFGDQTLAAAKGLLREFEDAEAKRPPPLPKK